MLYYPLVLAGARAARDAGYRVGIVTNGYWATSIEDAMEWLRPLSKVGIDDLSVSDDIFHYAVRAEDLAKNAVAAAKRLSLPVSQITVEDPRGGGGGVELKGRPVTGGPVQYRGRAAMTLAPKAAKKDWTSFDACPHENFADQQRVHLDPWGFVHACQGISIGNFREEPLSGILLDFDPRSHAVCGPLLSGGPAELARRLGKPKASKYADACHLCYEVRRRAREMYPRILAPPQVYGVDVVKSMERSAEATSR